MKTNTARVANTSTPVVKPLAAVPVAEETSTATESVSTSTVDVEPVNSGEEKVDATTPTEKTEKEKLAEMTAASEKAQAEKFAQREKEIAEQKEKERLAVIEAEAKAEQKWKDDEEAEFLAQRARLTEMLGELGGEQISLLRTKIAELFVTKREVAKIAEIELAKKQEEARKQRIDNQIAAMKAKLAALETEKETGVIVKPITGAGTTVKTGPTRVAGEVGHNGGARMQILGHSLCSVLRQLGHAGVNTHQAKEICARNGQDPSPTTIAIQLGNGRRGTGTGPLSAEQIQQLIAG